MPARLFACPECRQIVPVEGRARSCPTVGCEGKPQPLTARAGGGKRNKFNATPTWVDGIRFHSGREAKRYLVLKAMLAAGEIRDLRRQVPYRLVANGVPVTKYVADFVYLDKNGGEIVEDSKGFKTPEYKIKRALMKALLGIEIHEV